MSTTIAPPRRLPRHSPPGTTLVELVTVLLVMGLLSAAGLRAIHRLESAWAVRGASIAVAGLIREARFHAVARAGARVRLSAVPAQGVLEAGGMPLRTVDLGGEFGVTLNLSGAAEVVLVFDPAGVGRMASRTLYLRKGGAERRLVVSSYGRVRP